MKYYVVTIQIGDDSVSQSVIKADGVDEAAYEDALQKFHAEMSYCRLAKTLKKDTCIILNEDGQMFNCEVWVNETNGAE